MHKMILFYLILFAPYVLAEEFTASLSSVNINHGDTFTVDLKVENVTDLCGFEVNIVFNSSMLEIISIQEGSFLNETNPSNSFWRTPQINNTLGKVVNLVCVRMINGTGRSGSGVLATITLREKASTGSPYLTYVSFEEAQSKFSSSLAQPMIPIKYHPAAIKVGQLMAGDNTLDSNVDMADFAAIASFWLLKCEYLQDECFWSDSDNDREITLSDLLILCENWIR